MIDIESQFKKGKQVKLTSREKDEMRFRLLSYTRLPIRSEYSILSPYLGHIKNIWNVKAFVKVTAGALILLLVGAGSLTYASEQTLPGDLLYPIKIHVKEEIEVSLASTPVKKVNIQKHRIEKRIDEVRELQKTGELTSEQTETIKEAFVDHARELNNSFDELQTSGQEELVVAVAQDLLPTLIEFEAETTKMEEATLENKSTDQRVADTQTEEIVVTENIETIVSSTETVETNTTPEQSEKIVLSMEFQNLTSNLSDIVMVETQKIQAQATESLAVIDEKAAVSESLAITEVETVEEVLEPIILTKLTKTNEGSLAPTTFGTLNGQIVFEMTESTSTMAILETTQEAKNTLTGKIIIDTKCPLISILSTCEVDRDLYVNREVIIYNSDKTEVVSMVAVGEDGTFKIDLPLGKYFVDVTSLSRDEEYLGSPFEIEINAENITEIDIKIDAIKNTKSILQ